MIPMLDPNLHKQRKMDSVVANIILLQISKAFDKRMLL
jgi:hypothetical protein